MAVRVVLGAGFAVLLIGVALALTGDSSRVIASNYIKPEKFVATLEPGQLMCQGLEDMPKGTEALGFTAGTNGRPGPELKLTLTPRRGQGYRGVLPTGWREGDAAIPLDRPMSDAAFERVCIRSARGTGTNVVFVGEHWDGVAGRVTLDGKPGPVRIRLRFERQGGDSWYDAIGGIFDRFGVGKPQLLGTWALPAAFLLMAVAAGLAGWAILRGQRE